MIPSLSATLGRLAGAEVILVDGGSSDRTAEAARAAMPCFTTLTAPRGRASQSNAGAAFAKGDVLFFLHADSVVEPDAALRVEQAVADGAPWGCLRLRFDDPHPFMKLCALMSDLRVRLAGVAFGDQGIFVRRGLFFELGGFPDMPLMEDYEFSLRLKRRGLSPVRVDSPITTSARRFREIGRLRCAALMWRLRAMYRRGVPVEKIAAMYGDSR